MYVCVINVHGNGLILIVVVQFVERHVIVLFGYISLKKKENNTGVFFLFINGYWRNMIEVYQEKDPSIYIYLLGGIRKKKDSSLCNKKECYLLLFCVKKKKNYKND